MKLNRSLGLTTSLFVVVASMLGSFIFAVPGKIIWSTHDGLWLFIVWMAGGIIALTGALCYAELACMMPHVGGEYVYLRNIYGLLPAFLSGWISLFVAFSASIAFSAIFFQLCFKNFMTAILTAKGLEDSFGADPTVLNCMSACIAIFLGTTHIVGIKFGSRFQNILTSFKILFVLAFITAGIFLADWSNAGRIVADYTHHEQAKSLTFLTFGSTMISAMAAYSGYNGATYIAGEIENPGKNLPRALFFGTLIVIGLYLLINMVFLLGASPEKIVPVNAPDHFGGNYGIGAIAANGIFSNLGNVGFYYNLGLMLILLSSISVQMMIGPRVYYAMSQNRVIFSSLSKINNKFKTPHIAIMVQIVITCCYVFLGEGFISTLNDYIGFALSITPFIAVVGLMYLRRRYPNIERPYKIKLYPIIPLVFLTGSAYMMITHVIAKPMTSLAAIGLTVCGVAVFFIWKYWSIRLNINSNVEAPMISKNKKEKVAISTNS